MSIVYIGSDQPPLQALFDHVANKVGRDLGRDKWKDLGVQLLPRPMVDYIAEIHPQNFVACCKCVLEKWLDTTTDATWNQLIKALRSPSVQLDDLAGELEQMLSTERKNL